MTVVLPEVDTSLIENLDFEIEQNCEGQRLCHLIFGTSEKAEWHITVKAHCCGFVEEIYICDGCYNQTMIHKDDAYRCLSCNHYPITIREILVNVVHL